MVYLFFKFQDQSCTCIKDCDPSCQKRGIILAVCSSLMNHSCYPNVGTMFVEKQKLVQYTLRPIKKGEQVLHLSFICKKFYMKNHRHT